MATALRILKPTPAKVALGVALFAMAYVVQTRTWRVVDYWAYGTPFSFLEYWGPCPPGQTCQSFSPLLLVADLLFWYLAGVAIVALGNRLVTR